MTLDAEMKRRGGSLPRDLMLRIAGDVLSALEYAHRCVLPPQSARTPSPALNSPHPSFGMWRRFPVVCSLS